MRGGLSSDAPTTDQKVWGFESLRARASRSLGRATAAAVPTVPATSPSRYDRSAHGAGNGSITIHL